ncbi:MAG: hypothetical protein Q9228_004500 [Teloschistes exilis]
MAGDSLLQQLDAQLELLFAGWNIYTTLLLISIVSYLVYPIFFTKDPDTHPFLLARQSSPSYVRQPGESAVYRSQETPHGYPLKSGLNVKDPGAPKWTAGRDGDLRDVWKKAVQGPTDEKGESTGEPGGITTVLGKEEVVEHNLADVSKAINAVGEYLTQHGASRVAIYVPNSLEFLVTLFASAFHGFAPILIPQGQSPESLSKILEAANADTLVALAGSVPLQGLLQQYPHLKQVVWVVERTSRHMDWNEVPEGVGGKADIAVWHDIVEEKRSSVSTDLPSDKEPTKIVIASKDASNKADSFEIVEFSQQNIAAAVAAQISALPRPHRLIPSDLLLSLAPLTILYPLTITLAALYSNGSLAITSVTSDNAPYDAAFRSAKPTIVIASPPTIKAAVKTFQDLPKSTMQKYTLWRQASSLAEGIMPKIVGQLSSPRFIYTFEDSANAKAPLTLADLGDLRLLTGARTAYAFTDAKVAGAISQTSIYDYRRDQEAQQQAAFGGPVSAVEVLLVDADGHRNSDEMALGKLVVRGPAVVGGEAVVDRFMTVTECNTLAYANAEHCETTQYPNPCTAASKKTNKPTSHFALTPTLAEAGFFALLDGSLTPTAPLLTNLLFFKYSSTTPSTLPRSCFGFRIYVNRALRARLGDLSTTSILLFPPPSATRTVSHTYIPFVTVPFSLSLSHAHNAQESLDGGKGGLWET